jgi:ribosomal-protein-alanine N-acetyltransferase
MIIFSPFPVFETKNLILRRMDYNDTFDLFEMRNDQKMHEFTDTRPDINIDVTKDYIDRMNKGIDDNKWIIWAIEHKESNKVIGTVSIWNICEETKAGELGFGITPEYQGLGLMREALLCVIKYGFDEMNLKILNAYTEEGNYKSIKLLERCSFIEVNRVCDTGYINNRNYNMIVYRIENKLVK